MPIHQLSRRIFSLPREGIVAFRGFDLRRKLDVAVLVRAQAITLIFGPQSSFRSSRIFS